MKQVLTYQQILKIQQQQDPVNISISKYTDCLLIFINQTGAPGSILEGKMIESAGEAVYEERQEFGEEQTPPLYEMKVLFGSSEIQFYEVFLRRIMSLIWQDLKAKQNFRVLLNISLPVLSANFKQQAYYLKLSEEIRKGLKTVFD